MLMCKERATLVRFIDRGGGERYECVPLDAVSWYAKAETVVDEKGARTANVLKCRIPAGLLAEGPKELDYLVRGSLERVERTRDMEACEHFRITAVGDNRRGRFPHWVVSGS